MTGLYQPGQKIVTTLDGTEHVALDTGGANVARTTTRAIANLAGGGGGGWTKIASGKIVAPTQFLDIALPSGYFKFVVEFANFVLSTADHLSGAASYDGGATFACDPTNTDTYGVAQLDMSGPDGTTTSGILGGIFFNDDSLMNFSKGFSTTIDGTLSIYPGDANSQFRLSTRTEEIGTLASVAQRVLDLEWFFLNPGATVPPSNGRIDLLRILPYGNGDCNPPTSGETITAGSWALLGI